MAPPASPIDWASELYPPTRLGGETGPAESRFDGYMTDNQKERLLADCLEDYHRAKARGEIPNVAVYRERLGGLYEEFFELLLAETAIDQALESASDQPLPQNWGEYLLLGELGRGGAGVVYEAMHRKLGRKVALKVLRTTIDSAKIARERFRREAQALAQLSHENIVEIFEYGEKDDRLYYAMSLVEGPSLSALIKSDQRPSPAEVCRGLAGIADALQALHDAGIIHRDVKPGNIMIAPDGRYQLADFGLARTELAESMTRTGDALGTPHYMSPEQILGDRDQIEARTDIYGLGATLYQMLAGQPPFKTDNFTALLRMVLSQRPEDPRSVSPDLPPGCSSIAMKCLEKEPRDRYADAAELAVDLRAFADGERVSGRPVTATRRGLRLIKRRPLMTALGVAAAVLIGFGLWHLARPAPLPEASWVSVLVADNQPATVNIDGQDYPAPISEHGLKHGTDHPVMVTLDKDGYLPKLRTYRGEPGARYLFDVGGFEPSNPESQVTLGQIGEQHGIRRPKEPSHATGTHRGTGPELEIVFPRGAVRRADLETWTAFVTADFAPPVDGVIEFRRGDEVLHEHPFPPPQEFVEIHPIPAEVLAKIQPGDVITWGYRGARKRDKKVMASFTLVSNEVTAQVAAKINAVNQSMQDWTSERTKAIVGTTLRTEILL